MTDTNVGRTLVDSAEVPARFCFVCGAHMNETWRSAEPTGRYVWYECSRPGCDQNYLIREFTESGPVFNEIDFKV